MNAPVQQLIFHDSIALIVGLLSGAPMGRAIVNRAEPSRVMAWRVAHSGLVMGAVLLFAVAAILPRLHLSEFWAAVMAWAFIASAYGFIVALPYGASVGERGLQNIAGRGRVVYLGNMVGAIGSLIGGFILVVGSFLALCTEPVEISDCGGVLPYQKSKSFG
jgi:hypothetical protein